METTKELIEKARGGDESAFDRLFARASSRALFYIRMRLGRGLRGKIDSMDVLQEGYIEALRSFERFEYRGEDAFARWLTTIIENRLRDLAEHFGAKRRKPPRGLRHVSEVLEEARASGTGPATACGRIERRERIAASMDELEEEEREALLLRFYQERTVAEIGELMGRSPSAVRRLIGRATLRLGTLLGRTGEAGGGDRT